MTEFAYMRDLTERGKDVDLDNIDNVIYLDLPQQPEQH